MFILMMVINMILPYIQKKDFLAQITHYLDHTNLVYTTDFEDHYDLLLIAEINSNVLNKVKESLHNKKKIVFLTYLEEYNMYHYSQLANKKAFHYMQLLKDILKHCHLILTSLPFFKTWLKDYTTHPIRVIPKEIPCIENKKISKDYFNLYPVSRRKKPIVCIDKDYQKIATFSFLAQAKPKETFILVGYMPLFLLSRKKREIVRSLPKNVILIKTYSECFLWDVMKYSKFIILFEDCLKNSTHLYDAMMLKKGVLIPYTPVYDGYFTDHKTIYFFQDKEELLRKVHQILDNRISDLGLNGYEHVKSQTFEEIIKKLEKYLG